MCTADGSSQRGGILTEKDACDFLSVHIYVKLLFPPKLENASQDGLQLKLELKGTPVCGIPSSAVGGCNSFL